MPRLIKQKPVEDLIIPKTKPKDKTFTQALLRISDPSQYDIPTIRKDFVIVKKYDTFAPEMLANGDYVYVNKIITVRDETGKLKKETVKVINIIKTTKEQVTLLEQKMYNIKDIKIKENKVTEYFEKNPFVDVKGMKCKVHEFEGWIIQARQLEDDSFALIVTLA